jgi:short-subunit dehydrogenase
MTARIELQEDGIVVSEVYPYITATNFGKARMGGSDVDGPASNYADGDTPEFVASLIVKAIQEGNGQYFANDRIKRLAGQ